MKKKTGHIAVEIVGFRDQDSHSTVAAVVAGETSLVALLESIRQIDFLRHNRLSSLWQVSYMMSQAEEAVEASGTTTLHLRFHDTIGETVISRRRPEEKRVDIPSPWLIFLDGQYTHALAYSLPHCSRSSYICRSFGFCRQCELEPPRGWSCNASFACNC